MSNNQIILAADDATAAPLVATIRAAVNGNGKYAAYVTAHSVTRENVKHHALALAVLAYPNEKPIQKTDGKRTKFGNAVQAAGNGLRSALDKTEPGETDYLARLIKAAEAAEAHDVSAEDIRSALAHLFV